VNIMQRSRGQQIEATRGPRRRVSKGAKGKHIRKQRQIGRTFESWALSSRSLPNGVGGQEKEGDDCTAAKGSKRNEREQTKKKDFVGPIWKEEDISTPNKGSLIKQRKGVIS